MDIDNILRQHDEVFEIIKKMRTYQNQEKVQANAFEISKLLAQLSGILKVHLLSEDKFVYPALMKQDDDKVRTTAETFAKEMGELGETFEAYKIKYLHAGKISDDAAAFLAATKEVFTALENRINRENARLYPLLK